MTLLTSLFYSKLYYGSEICHIPGRTITQNKKLKLASTNAIRSCDKSLTIFHSHTQIHSLANRALPDQMLNYKHAIVMFKLFKTRERICTDELPTQPKSKTEPCQILQKAKLRIRREHTSEQTHPPQ